MVIERFPPIETADEHGLLALGGDLDIESLLLAYSSGIFPWPLSERRLAWFSPPRRALLFLKDLHISRSLVKERARTNYTYRFNHDFEAVIKSCSEVINRGEQDGTWITPQMIRAYCRLHREGFAHSFACYEEERMIGGFYGVSIGAMFAGESSFFRKPNASKLCFWVAMEQLQRFGVEWIDCQVMTPLSRSFGAVEVERDEFLALLKYALERRTS